MIGHSMGGVIALEMAARFPELPAAIVVLDSPIVPPQSLRDALAPLLEALTTPGHKEAQRKLVADVLFLPTDDAKRKARIVKAMSNAPQHVMAPAFGNILKPVSE